VTGLLEDAWLANRERNYPQVLIIISARFQRIAWTYESIAHTTLLKNVGALFQTMYLVATAMNLAPCALGNGNSDLFAAAAGTDYYAETSVGEFILGSKLLV
jgi:SagB-type dehydrogenase family enzyme